jgi:hypothetical protein
MIANNPAAAAASGQGGGPDEASLMELAKQLLGDSELANPAAAAPSSPASGAKTSSSSSSSSSSAAAAAAAASDAPVSMDEALNMLSQGAKDMKSSSPGGPGAMEGMPALPQLFAGLGDMSEGDEAGMEAMLKQLMEGAGADGGDFEANLMKTLVNKEFLYDPIKAAHAQYADYMEKNKGSIAASDMANYVKQRECFGRMVALWDAHGDSRPDEVMAIMNELQAYGQPISEITDGFLGPGMGGLPGMGMGNSMEGMPDLASLGNMGTPEEMMKELENVQCPQQ